MFGAERRGAPVTAFVRMSAAPIRRRCEIRQPGFLIIQDPTLLGVSGVLAGLAPGGGIVVNAGRKESLPFDAPAGARVAFLPATRLALEALGRPLPNVAMLAAFLALTQFIPLDALGAAIDRRFTEKIAAGNRALIDAAVGCARAGEWAEERDALSA